MSIPTHMRETEAWKFDNGIAPEEVPDNLQEDVVRPFENLTGKSRFAELEKLFATNKQSVIDPTCVRNTSNWATVEKHHKFDSPDFDAIQTADDIKTRSPKLHKILKNIRKLDKEDQSQHGRKFKHFIFSDIKGAQGAKAIASGLLAEGYHMGYDVKKTNKKTHITVKSPAELLKTKYNNFFFLSSISIHGEPLLVSVKKEVLAKFNSRPDNVYGDLARIIVMDSGFKEGIDLFDIKYVHIFEPQTTTADQKQVIGRGTRTCGQKGLRFHPRMGWPLYVFKYDLSIEPKYRADFHGAETAFQYYLQSKNVDIRLVNLMSNLENLAIKGSVDYKLNLPIHKFSSDDPDMMEGGNDMMEGGNEDDSDDDESSPTRLRTAEENLMRKLLRESRPGKKYRAVKKYIQKYFSEYTWPPVKMENLCGYEGPTTPVRSRSSKSYSLTELDKKIPQKQREVKSLNGGESKLITLSPTQDFVSSYFTSKTPIKGMLLWHSVGTGKTCSAIATATRQFEPLGYTILWVTRTTLKNDIWKNMFDMVCHENIREKVEAGVKIPNDMPGRMRLLSKSWGVRPMSYKQFSNLVSKNNQYYEQLVKRNGEEDPLRKTLIIIDEAHKLYGGGDLSTIERPDMPAFHKALMHSYAVSGEDSVRVLFMTATPITENPLELVQLVNLCKPANQQIPTEFGEFADTFLDDTGDFTAVGRKMFLDRIAGHISYLNREGDVRQFSRPILREVEVPLVDKHTAKDIAKFDVVGAKELDRHSESLHQMAEEAKTKYDNALKGFTKANAQKVDRVCDEYGNSPACIKLAKKYTTRMMKTAKARADELKTEMKNYMLEWRNSKHAKSDQFKSVRFTRKNNEQEYENYQKTAYYKLKSCETEWKDAPNFDRFLESQPVFSKARDLENVIKEELKTVNDRLNADVLSQLSKIRSYTQLLKTDLTFPETQVVRRTILHTKQNIEKTKKRNTKLMKRMTKRANGAIERLSKYQKKVKQEIRKSVKQQMKMDQKLAKEEDKAHKLDETADDDLTDVFKESLAEAQEAVRQDMETVVQKEDEKHNKAVAKAEKKKMVETRKVEKKKMAEQKKADNATRKLRAKIEKEQKQAEKEADKKKRDEQKQAEKEANKKKKQEEMLEAKRKKEEEKELAKKKKEAEMKGTKKGKK